MAGGRYVVEVTARGLAEGSRWIVQVDQADDDGGPEDFRRAAVDGGWKVLTRFQASTDPEDDLFFILGARERGDRGHRCSVLNSQASPVAGLAQCNNRGLDIVLISRERDDGSTAVRSIIFDVHPDSRWHLTLTATAAAGRQVVDFHDRADRREGVVDSRVVLTGVEDPQLRMVAGNKDQGRCFIGLDPPAATTDAPPTPTLKGLDKLRAP